MKKNNVKKDIKKKLAAQKQKDIARYQEEFEHIGISKFSEYTSPEEYAIQFKRCSILQSEDVIYSASTTTADETIRK